MTNCPSNITKVFVDGSAPSKAEPITIQSGVVIGGESFSKRRDIFGSTSNLSELYAILDGLQKGIYHLPIVVLTDSSFAYLIAQGYMDTNITPLRVVQNDIRHVVKTYSTKISFYLIPRELNKEADRASKKNRVYAK